MYLGEDIQEEKDDYDEGDGERQMSESEALVELSAPGELEDETGRSKKWYG